MTHPNLSSIKYCDLRCFCSLMSVRNASLHLLPSYWAFQRLQLISVHCEVLGERNNFRIFSNHKTILPGITFSISWKWCSQPFGKSCVKKWAHLSYMTISLHIFYMPGIWYEKPMVKMQCRWCQAECRNRLEVGKSQKSVPKLPWSLMDR